MTNLELLLLILAIFGGVDLAWRGVSLLSSAFPKLLSAQARLWRGASDTFAIAAFKRKAIATQIEEVLNQSAYELQPYLPKGWVRRAKINWVRSGQEAFLGDGDIVLRIRPDADNNRSLMQSLWIYFQRALFPEAQGLLPEALLSGAALAVSRAALEKSHSYLLDSFDKTFLEGLGEDKAEVLEKFSDCVRLNDYGLLMGPFVRELDYAVQSLRFRADKKRVVETADAILTHLLSFQPLLRMPIKPEDEWALKAEGTSYGIILVSRPPEFRPNVEAYVKRAQAHVQNGVLRIYVIGRYEERDFVHAVVKALLSIRELKGTELFALFRDYRGDEGGVGALLSIDGIIAKLGLSPRHFDESQLQLEAPLTDSPSPATVTSGSMIEVTDDLAQITRALITQLSNHENPWVHIATFGFKLKEKMPDFTPERYGCGSLSSVLKKLSFLEFEERLVGQTRVLFIRLKSDSSLSPSVSTLKVKKPIWSEVEEVIRAQAKDDGWIFIGALGNHLRKRVPGFSFSEHGAASFHEFVSSIPTLEIQERGEGHSKTYVRLRPQTTSVLRGNGQSSA